MNKLWLWQSLVFALLFGKLSAQTITVDMRSIQDGSYHIVGPDVDETGSTNEPGVFNLDGAGQCTLDLSIAGRDLCTIRFEVAGDAQISDLEWRAPTPVSTSYVTLGSGYYELESEGTELVLGGQSIYLDKSSADLQRQKLTGPKPVEGQTHRYLAFPGFYTIDCPAADAAIGFLAAQGDTLLPSVYHSDSSDTSTAWVPLNPGYFSVMEDSFILKSKVFGLDMGYLEDQDFLVQGMKAGIGQIDAGASGTVKLLPGRYSVRLTDSLGSQIGTLRFRLLNRTGELSPQLTWKLDTVETFKTVEAGHYYMERFAMTAALPLPDPIDSDPPGPYASLQEKLDGGYTLMRGGYLWFRYDERYASNADMDLRILDPSNQEVTLPGAVSRDYGANWVQLNLSSAGLTNGQFYVLEVKGPKGEVGRLRFKVQP